MAPGALETLQKGGGLRPHLSEGFLGPPGAAQTAKMTDFQSFENCLKQLPSQSAATACLAMHRELVELQLPRHGQWMRETTSPAPPIAPPAGEQERSKFDVGARAFKV